MKNIFVTATNTDVGKTYTTLKLLHALTEKGYRVGAFKPIETGVKESPHDGLLLLEACQTLNPAFKDITIQDICPIQFSLAASPYVAKKGIKIDFEKIQTSYTKLQKHCDILLIEGAGGLQVPVCEDFYMIDFIKFFNAQTLLVTDDKLGSINATLLSIETLKHKNITFTWCVNIFDDNNYKTTMQPFYEQHFKKVHMVQKDIDKIIEALKG